MRPAFASEVRIPWKDPTSLLPRTNGVGTEPTPERGAADLGDYALSDHLLADIGQGQPREGQSEAMRQLTGEGFYLYDDAGGKQGGTPTPRLFFKARQTSLGKSFAPLAHDLARSV